MVRSMIFKNGDCNEFLLLFSLFICWVNGYRICERLCIFFVDVVVVYFFLLYLTFVVIVINISVTEICTNLNNLNAILKQFKINFIETIQNISHCIIDIWYYRIC